MVRRCKETAKRRMIACASSVLDAARFAQQGTRGTDRLEEDRTTLQRIADRGATSALDAIR